MWSKYLNDKRLRKSNADASRKKMSSDIDIRNAYESDFGRVVFSAASRRLHDKTQVFPLTEDDNIHSRLTHSLEVMNIGLSFSIYLSGNKTFCEKTGLQEKEVMREINPILKTACLVHDIGNPPFGHFGEDVFQDYFKNLFQSLRDELDNKNTTSSIARHIKHNLQGEKEVELKDFLNNTDWCSDYCSFDGNAEGLRVLTKLQYIGDLYGLNLTTATLAASLKYPNIGQPIKDGNIAQHKHGVFFTERETVKKIAESCDLAIDNSQFKRHPLTFIVEAADSICYLVMDIEDAISKGWFDAGYVRREINDSDKISVTVKKKIESNAQQNGGSKLSSMNEWVMLRTTILSHLMEVASNNFVSHLDEIEKGIYNKELIEDGDSVYYVLKQIALNKILNRKEIVSLEITGRAVISGLFDSLLTMLFHSNVKFRSRAKTFISKSIFKAIMHEHMLIEGEDTSSDEVQRKYENFDVSNLSVEERFRLVRDYVACMTDKYALSQFQKISGQKIL